MVDRYGYVNKLQGYKRNLLAAENKETWRRNVNEKFLVRETKDRHRSRLQMKGRLRENRDNMVTY